MGELSVIVSINDLCRLCASKIDAPMAFNICDADQRGLLKKINTCLPLEVSITDNYPKAVCMECTCKLDLIFEFRERCLLTAHLFEEMVSTDVRGALVLPPGPGDGSIIVTPSDFQTCDEACRLDDTRQLSGAIAQLNPLPLTEKAVLVEPLPTADLVNEDDQPLNLLESAKGERETVPKESLADLCEPPSNKGSELVAPVKSKTEKGKCNECGKVCGTNYKLQEHMRRHTGEKPFKCSFALCTKSFRSKIGLAQHEASHSGQFEFSCPTCGKGFQCKSYLVVHQRAHSDAKPYPCQQCSRCFKTKNSLLDHVNRHLGVKPYLCDICGRGFITKGLCKSHQKVHSGTDNRQYPCPICSKLFVSKSYLNTHLRIHSGNKPFMCEVCGKNFLTRVDLRIHSTMHTGEKSFVCETCGKAFARRDALRCHKRSHTGERPYKCDFCGQSFTQFTPMAIHKRLHTGERPYSCDLCPKTFVSRSTMMSHRKKNHDPGKPKETSNEPQKNETAFPDLSCSANLVKAVSVGEENFNFSDEKLKVELLDMEHIVDTTFVA